MLLPGMGFWLLCRAEEPCCLLLTPITHLTSISSPSTTPRGTRSVPQPPAQRFQPRGAVLRSLLQASPFCATLPLVARKDGNRGFHSGNAAPQTTWLLGWKGTELPTSCPCSAATHAHGQGKLGVRRPRRTGAITSRGPLGISQALVVDGAGSVEVQPRAEVSETSPPPPVSPPWSPQSPG